MNKFVVFFALLTVSYAVAGPLTAEQAARRQLPALQHEEVRDNLSQYALRYVTAEGTVVSERGYLVPNSEGNGYVMVVEGQTTYIGEDGKTYTTKYSAGPDGSKIEGEHLPVAPKVPEMPELPKSNLI